MQPVFRALELTALILVKTSGVEITLHGLDRVPRSGGAVIAINHTSYGDFLPAAPAMYRRGRRMRFMLKAEIQQVKTVDFPIRHTGAIPVDRHAYRHAVAALRAGEVVGVYPEATLSRSFELKEFKTGAARMAPAAQVPIVPLIVWGAQRVWTKDHPRARLVRNNVPVGAPIRPAGEAAHLIDAPHGEMAPLLQRVQLDYPHPAGAYSVPRRMGGSAPTLAEAKVLEERELAERARKRNME